MSLSIKEIDSGLNILSSKILTFISSSKDKVTKKSLIHFIKNSNTCCMIKKSGDVCNKKVKVDKEIYCKIHSKKSLKTEFSGKKEPVIKEVVEKHKRYKPVRINEGLLKNYFILEVDDNKFITDINYVYGLFLSVDKEPKELEEKYIKLLKEKQIPLDYKPFHK